VPTETFTQRESLLSDAVDVLGYRVRDILPPVPACEERKWDPGEKTVRPRRNEEAQL
jgi:hypothetical protein